MAVPDFLNGGFRYFTRAGVTDVNTIISDLMSELVTNGVWTDSGGAGTGPFVSPVLSDGSYMKITLTRSSATRLNWVCNDHRGLLINNQTSNNQDIDAAGNIVRLVTAKDLVCVVSERATAEVFILARLNQWPEDQTKTRPSFVCTYGPRNTSGTLTNNSMNYWFGLAQNATAYAQHAPVHWGRYSQSSETHLVSLSGAYVFMPMDFVSASGNCWLGRMPNCLIMDTSIADGSEFAVPIDVGVSGTFRVIGITVSSYYRKMAVRVA